MSFTAWTSRVRHDSDATYQEWRDEYITRLGILVAAGDLAADETNITPGAGARPGLSAEGGYAVYHLDDSLHATAPIYFRIGFGTTNNATFPRLQITIGTSTNGSGVLGGTALTTIRQFNTGSTQVTDTARASYFSATEGFFGMSWKQGSGANEASFFCARTVDSSGVPDARGAMICWGQGSTSIQATQALRFASPAAAYTLQTAINATCLGLNAQGAATTAVGADDQVFVGYTITPRMEPIIGMCGVLSAVVPAGNTFSVALVGSTPHTYIGLTTQAGQFGGIGADSAGGLKYCMLWE